MATTAAPDPRAAVDEPAHAGPAATGPAAGDPEPPSVGSTPAAPTSSDDAEGDPAPTDHADPAGPAGPAGPPVQAPAPTWQRIAVPALIVLAAGVLRLWGLDDPPRIFFDEVYYVDDARAWLELGTEPHFTVHPPVGKLLMAGAMAVVGDTPFGWRLAPALAGTATVLLTYLIGLRLLRRRGVAALAAFLVAIDGLALTMSRIAMLDAILAVFIALGVWLLLIDTQRRWEMAVPGDGRLPPRPHLHRWLAGLAFGLAVATKWSGLWALGGAVILVAVSELLVRRRVTGSPWTEVHRAVGSVLLTLVALPALVYIASYASWFVNLEDSRHGERLCPDDGVCEIRPAEAMRTWWDEQLAVARFHAELDATHPYRSRATAWPALQRPVAYYYESCTVERRAEGTCEVDEGNVAEILGLGNPALWWLALVSYPLLALLLVRGRDWRAGVILLFLLAQYLPWLAAARPLFFFYMTPAVPFIALALACASEQAAGVRVLRWAPAAVALLAFAAFAFWLPIWVGHELPRESWELRMWLPSWV